MSRFKLRLLASGAIMAASALAVSANATTPLHGGGSSLLAPYWAQTVGCFDNSTGSPSNNGSYIEKGVIKTPTVPTNCNPVAVTSIQYASTGSGAGQAGVFAHDGPITNHDGTAILFGDFPLGSGTKVFTSGGIQYGLSDNALVDNDVGVYSVGTGASYVTASGSTITTPASYQGLTFGAGGDYPVAKPKYGPLVQFPVSIDPVAIAYNPSYDGVHNLAPAGGKLKLDPTAYCKIFTGQITDWNDAYLTTLNGGASLTGGASATIHLVGRSDSSGTTSIFTRHLAAVCDSLISGANPYGTAGVTTLPGAVAGLFTTASGSSGVASTLNSTAGSIGYIGPDYVMPAVANTGANTFALPAAQLQNAGGGSFLDAKDTTALTAFTATAPTGADAANPLKWVDSTSETASLANPTTSGAYPIVGTTNFIGYSCYAQADEVTTLQTLIANLKTNKAKSILSAAGLSALPNTFLNAIANTFSAPTSANNLGFAKAGTGADATGHVNTNCTIAGVVGG